MTFLNSIMLIGALGVSVPIIIHLISRSNAKPVDWGAMRFLLASIAAQSRRLLIEEALLLILRCLLILLVALALARPFLPSNASLPWVIIFPCILGTVICIGTAVAIWSNAKIRKMLLKTALILAVIATTGSIIEKKMQIRKWFKPAGSSDIAIIVDSSASMTINVDGEQNFKRAIHDTEQTIKACGSDDSITVILAGPSPRVINSPPSSDRNKIMMILKSDDIRPTGGSMDLFKAFNAAISSLSEGRNTAKQILIITDGQNVGWELQNPARWQFIAESLKSIKGNPKILCRKLDVPSNFRNASASDIMLSRDIIGPDRPVDINVKVANAGSSAILPSTVVLNIDGTNVQSEIFSRDIPGGSSETIKFNYLFNKAGRHVIKAEVTFDDDMPCDNSLKEVVNIVDSLPVLIIDGAPAQKFSGSASGFIKIALNPSPAAPAGDQQGWQPSCIIAPEVVPVVNAAAIPDFAKYRSVILANVSELPAPVALKLSEFVKSGGGLLIAPGNLAEAPFYNSWKTPAEETVCPGMMLKRITSSDSPFKVSTGTDATHSALKLVWSYEKSDISKALAEVYWKLQVNPEDKSVTIASRFENGDPWIIERKLGKGKVIMTATAMDRHDSNLPSLKSFLPLIHEIVYFISQSGMAEYNIQPGAEFTLDIKESEVPANIQVLKVATPSGRQVKAEIKTGAGKRTIRFPETQEPGLYDIRTSDTASIPFTVRNQPEESSLKIISDFDLAVPRQNVEVLFINSIYEFTSALKGNIPGKELWKNMIIAVLILLVVETAFTRWIAIRRRFHSATTVTPKSPIIDFSAFRKHAKNILTKENKQEPDKA